MKKLTLLVLTAALITGCSGGSGGGDDGANPGLSANGIAGCYNVTGTTTSNTCMPSEPGQTDESVFCFEQDGTTITLAQDVITTSSSTAVPSKDATGTNKKLLTKSDYLTGTVSGNGFTISDTTTQEIFGCSLSVTMNMTGTVAGSNISGSINGTMTPGVGCDGPGTSCTFAATYSGAKTESTETETPTDEAKLAEESKNDGIPAGSSIDWAAPIKNMKALTVKVK